MSISSTVVSFFSYFQNLGCTVSLPSLNLPPELTNILNSVRNFLGTLQSFLPQIPKFDIRSQLIIMSVGIPLILDIFFVWFVQPIVTTIFHIVDIAAIVFLFISLATGFLKAFTILTYVLIGLLSAYIIARFIYLFCKSKGGVHGLVQIARNVCNHYLYGMIPNIQAESSINDLNKVIQRFSAVVEIKPQKASVFGSITIFMIATLLFLLSLWCLDVIPMPIKLPETLALIFPYIGIPFAAIFFLAFFLRLCECGRRFTMSFKQFCKRWGLRLLMLAFDLLYIPIISQIVSHVMVTKEYTCPVGEYLKIMPDKYMNTISLLVSHDYKCTPCNMTTLSDRCIYECSAPDLFRPQGDPTLTFFEDILKVNGGFILYGIIFVMFGIPCLWFYIINRNRTFAYVINVYGIDPATKWLRLVNRMKTTGIFLFVNYKFNSARWSVFYLFVKFIVMVISTIAGHIWPYLTFMLPLFYLIVFICIVCKRPYLYFFNNVLDCVLYFTQFIFALVPVLAFFNVQIPDAATKPLAIIVCVVPVVSIIFLMFFKRKSCNFEDDPTYPQKLTEEEELELEHKRKKAKRKLENKRKKAKAAAKKKKAKNSPLSDTSSDNSVSDPFLLPDIDPQMPNNIPSTIPEEGGDVDGYQRLIDEDEKAEKAFLEELDENENVCLIPEDEYEVKPGELDNVQTAITCTKKYSKTIVPEDGEESYVVNRRVLTNRMESMYQMLDIIVDGSTIDFLTTALNIAIMFGMAAFGWYIGALILAGVDVIKPVCDEL